MPLRRLGLLALWIALGASAWAQEPPPAEPPEEDQALVPKEYSFNPLQAKAEVKIGDYYFKKGSYRAAAGRFLEATKWNPTFAEAYLRLGDAYEKMKDTKEARKAYQKYLELDPKSKDAPQIRKKLAGKP